MERKQITKFLKVMSIITIIRAVLGIILYSLVVFFIPGISETLGVKVVVTQDFNFWLAVVVDVICLVVNIVLAVMALKHKRINIVSIVAIFTMILQLAFNTAYKFSIGNYLTTILSAVIPFLFYYAAYRQNKLDRM